MEMDFWVVALMRRRARLWPSCRLNLALMCLAATLGFFLMRLNLSFALVCMVRQPINRPVNVTTIGNATSSSRPYDLTYDDDQHQVSRSLFYANKCRYMKPLGMLIFGGRYRKKKKMLPD
jgi:hypothetical protein